MTRDRRIELAFAAVLAIVAAAISPWAIQLLTGRPVLSLPRHGGQPRTRSVPAGRRRSASWRKAGRAGLRFHLMLWTFPLAVLAGLEATAIAVRLADRIAPLEDNSSLRNWRQWPAYLLSDARWAEPADGVRVYRPWKGEGIEINEFGLRTAAPTPKAAGRMAHRGHRRLHRCTAGAWSTRDTIPAQLQGLIRIPGKKVTVYNFGIEGATLDRRTRLAAAIPRRLCDRPGDLLHRRRTTSSLHYMNRSDPTEGVGRAHRANHRLRVGQGGETRSRALVRTRRSVAIGTRRLRSRARMPCVKRIAAARSYCDATGLRLRLLPCIR